MKLDKIQLTIPNSLYGDKVVTAYAACGLAVAKVNRTWTVYHVASGATVNGRYHAQTRKEAADKMQQLIALAECVGNPHAWEDPLDGPSLVRLFDLIRDDIRRLLK